MLKIAHLVYANYIQFFYSTISNSHIYILVQEFPSWYVIYLSRRKHLVESDSGMK